MKPHFYFHMELKITNKKGEVFTVLYDDEDHELVSRYRWYIGNDEGRYYVIYADYSTGKKKTISLHRVIMGLTDPKLYVDHINRNPLDNRRCNLRVCTCSDNQKNKKASPGKTSAFLGVCWDKSHNRWYASIRFNGKVKNLGRFINEVDAAIKYDEYARKYHGEFANPNFPS